MNLNPDDPRLTAYALGELDEAERAEIEAALARSPAAQAEVEAIRATATRLNDEFEGEAALALTAEQRERLEATVNQTDVQPAFTPRPSVRERRGLFDWTRYLIWGTAGVCAVVLAVALLPNSAATRNLEKSRQLASLPESATRLDEKLQRSAVPSNQPLSENEAPPAPKPAGTAAAYGLEPLEASRVNESAAAAPAADFAGIQPPTTAGEIVGKPVESEVKIHATIAEPVPPATQLNLGLFRTEELRLSKESIEKDKLAGIDQNSTVAGGAAAGRSTTLGERAETDPVLARRYRLAMPPDSLAQSTAVPQGATRNLSRPASLAAGPAPGSDTRTKTSAEDRFAAGGGLGGGANGRGLSRESKTESERIPPADAALRADTKALDDLGRKLATVVELKQADYYQVPEGRYWYFKTPPAPGTESYAAIADNPFKEVTANPLSTFSIDVDTASYANVRRFLREGQRPPPNAVRLEELINYFSYDYPQPHGEHPFSATVDVATCPWRPEHKLVRIGVKAKSIERRERPHANLVFLVDVSGSMEPENKLPLVKRGLRLLVERLGSADYVGIVTYAGRAEVALEPTSCDDKATILATIERLVAGSGTNGGEGIQRAYEMARRRFEKSAVNRIILCTDGDFNVGITSREELKGLIESEARSGVFLSVLGFGMGNTKDDTMEMLADKGNGHYGYVDSFTEARKVFSEQLEGTLVTIAKDVKIQVEFNPAKVATWRLLGYENRVMADRDFNDDRKDAGEVGAGHSVTALYEVVPAGMVAGDRPEIDGLRYRAAIEESDTREKRRVLPPGQHKDELLFLKVRYKKPDGEQSILMEQVVNDGVTPWKQANADFKFTAAVAGFGMILRDSPHRGDTSFESVLRLAEEGLGRDENGYRSEFIDLVRRAQSLK